jgi:hypothetical protein
LSEPESDANLKAVDAVRASFEAAAARLTCEVEPAVLYRLPAPEAEDPSGEQK